MHLVGACLLPGLPAAGCRPSPQLVSQLHLCHQPPNRTPIGTAHTRSVLPQLIAYLWMQLVFDVGQGNEGNNGEADGCAGETGGCTWMDEFWLRVYRMCRSLSMTMSRIGEGLCHILGTKPGRYADTPLDRSLCDQIKQQESASWLASKILVARLSSSTEGVHLVATLLQPCVCTVVQNLRQVAV